MKPKLTLKPEDRMKALMLGGTSVVVLIVGGWNVLHMLQSSPRNAQPGAFSQPGSGQTTSTTGEPAPAPGLSTNFPGAVSANPLPTGTTTATGVQTDIQPGTKPGIQISKLDMYADDLLELPTTHDPFTPVIPLPPNNATRDGRAHARPFITGTPSVVSNPGAGRTTGLDIPNGLRSVTGGTVAPIQRTNFMDAPSVSGNTTEELTLGGVISGPSAVAVLHQGGHCYPLFAGEKLPNQMILTRITDTGIYLVAPATTDSHLPGKTWFLEIGKPFHAAIPIRIHK